MQNILITFLVLLLSVPAGAETMRERLQKAREQEHTKTETTKSNETSIPPEQEKVTIRDGIVRTEYPNGSPRQISAVRKGKRDGETKTFFENGQIESSTMYQDDQAEGASQMYYSNGKVKTEEFFKNGALHGTRKMYYENGQIKQEENYLNGTLDGTVTAYHTNGKVQSTVDYINGKQEGKISEYYLAGPIGREVFFEGGKKRWEKKYIYNEKGDDPNKQLYINETIYDEGGHLKVTNRYDASGKLFYSQ